MKLIQMYIFFLYFCLRISLNLKSKIMKKIALFVSTIVLAVIFCACGSSSSPKAVVNDYYKALKNGDFEKALTYTTAKDEEIQQQVKKLQDFKFKVSDYEILSENIAEDGENATVEVKYTASNAFKETPEEQTETVKLIKVDGKWKINE